MYFTFIIILICIFNVTAILQRYDSIFIPTNNLPNQLTENVRSYSIAIGNNKSLVYTSISNENLILLNLDSFETTILGDVPNFSSIHKSLIINNLWILFSFLDPYIHVVDLSDFNNRAQYIWNGCASCAIVDVLTYSEAGDINDVDGNGTFWILTDDRTVLEFSVAGFASNVNSFINPTRISSVPSGLAGINSGVYHAKSNSLFVSSMTGVLVRFDILNFDWIVGSTIVCTATAPRINTMQIDEEKDLLYVPCPGRSASTLSGFAPTGFARVNITSLNNILLQDYIDIPQIGDTVLQYNQSYLLSPAETDSYTTFLDTDGDLFYMSIQPRTVSQGSSQGAIVEISHVSKPKYLNLSSVPINATAPNASTPTYIDPRSVSYLFLEKKFEELFQHVYFDPRHTSAETRFAYYFASPLPQSVNQVGRIIKVEITDACPAGCYNGNCVRGICECTGNWLGESCLAQCPSTCGANGHGSCNSVGVCDCDADWRGLDCSSEKCKNKCSGHGTCNEETYLCECYAGFFGDDCGQGICEGTTCVSCLSTQCYWCSTTKTCVALTSNSSLQSQSCGIHASFTDVCQSKITTSIAGTATISAFLGLLMLYNMKSAVKDDNQPVGRIYARQSWWRSQRSAKLWAIMDQFQFIALTGCVGVSHPRLWATFTSGFAWSNLWLNPGWDPSYHKIVGGGVYQLSREAGINPDYFLYSNIWYIFLVFLVFLTTMAAIGKYRDRRLNETGEDIWPYVHERLIYVAVRLVTFAQLGLTVSASYEIISASNGGRKFFGVIMLLVTFSIPILIRTLFVKNPKGMLQKEFRKKFGSLYEPLNVKKLWYASVPSSLRFVYGMLIGLTQNIPALGVAIVIIFKFFYILQLLFVKPRPFLDPSFMFLDLVRNFLDILTVGLLLVFSSNVNTTSTLRSSASVSSLAAEAIMIGMQLVCILLAFVTFLVAWAGMHNIHTFSHIIETIRSGKTPRRRDIELQEMQKKERKKEAEEEKKVEYNGLNVDGSRAPRGDDTVSNSGNDNDNNSNWGGDNNNNNNNNKDNKSTFNDRRSSTGSLTSAPVGTQVVISIPNNKNNRKSVNLESIGPKVIDPNSSSDLPPVFLVRSATAMSTSSSSIPELPVAVSKNDDSTAVVTSSSSNTSINTNTNTNNNKNNIDSPKGDDNNA